MSRQQSSAAASSIQESEWETYYRLITHDDRNSYYVVSSCANGTWTDTAVKKDSLPALGFNPRASYYMTHNGFTSCCRKSHQVRQLNALFFDLDCHNQNASRTQATVHRALNVLQQAVEAHLLPQPTMTINSGRGVQLFFVLERSVPYRFESGSINQKAIRLFELVQSGLANTLERIVSPVEGLEVDRATFDVSRVSRIPGTFNAKAGRFASLVQHADVFYSLSNLYSFTQSNTRQKPQCLRASFAHPASIMRFQPMLMSRLGKLIELQKYRNYNCEGTRELMSFVFYNTAVQIYTRDEAKTRLKTFNDQFIKPLDHKELAGVITSVDEVINIRGEKGYYLIGAQRLTELLALTPQELFDLNFFESKRSIERKEQKQLTAQRKQTRNRTILSLKQEGYTHAQIAKSAGCSPRTVATVLKAAGQTVTRNIPRKRNIILVERYNKKHGILCNFLSYESLKCSPVPSLSHSMLQVSSGSSFCSRCASVSPIVTKTLFPLILVSFQRALSFHILLVRESWRSRCFLYCCLLQ